MVLSAPYVAVRVFSARPSHTHVHSVGAVVGFCRPPHTHVRFAEAVVGILAVQRD